MSEVKEEENEENQGGQSQGCCPEFSCIDYFKSFDAFGYNVVLNASKSNVAYQTFCGGITTILVKVFIFVYIIILFTSMVSHGQDV